MHIMCLFGPNILQGVREVSGPVNSSDSCRHEVPHVHKFEIYSEIPCSVSTESRSIYFIVKDSLSYFIDSTKKGRHHEHQI